MVAILLGTLAFPKFSYIENGLLILRASCQSEKRSKAELNFRRRLLNVSDSNSEEAIVAIVATPQSDKNYVSPRLLDIYLISVVQEIHQRHDY